MFLNIESLLSILHRFCYEIFQKREALTDSRFRDRLSAERENDFKCGTENGYSGIFFPMGQRTDIPGFFSRWFINRVKEKFVFVRSPYAPQQLLRYRIEPEVVDILSFCTKNPAPMLPHLEYIRRFPQIWQVTITPYGKEIEPGVPEKSDVIKAFQALSKRVGAAACLWRYDPVFLSETYSAAFHREAFAKLACALRGFTTVCVVSFIDCY